MIYIFTKWYVICAIFPNIQCTVLFYLKKCALYTENSIGIGALNWHTNTLHLCTRDVCASALFYYIYMYMIYYLSKVLVLFKEEQGMTQRTETLTILSLQNGCSVTTNQVWATLQTIMAEQCGTPANLVQWHQKVRRSHYQTQIFNLNICLM